MTTSTNGGSSTEASPRLALSPVVQKLAQAVNLESVRLMKADAEILGISAGETLSEIKLEVFAGGERSPDSRQALRIFAGARLDFLPSSESTKVLVRLSCHFALDYKVAEEALFASLGESDITAFATTNGIYNAWPYVREYSQSTLARMQLSGVLLPSFNVGRMLALQAQKK
ncbi:hypothetical protein [Corallococcus sp. CA054B]|uniref:hypothetical protein n=1 Tax=Corallococcus sp. CA054B TaxID=2316734 RepID=UPI0011C4A3CA|nr:hypothetical protein [Corallococcus sp. CA054B]